MKRLFSGLTASLIVLGSSLTSLAQDDSSLLWKISGKEMVKPSYLFGTIHMLPKDKYFFSKKMQEALTNSDILALEAEIDIPLSEQMKMASQMMMPDGKTWADFMTEEEYAAVKSAFVDSLGIKEKKIDKYAKIRPIYISGLIMTELLGKVKMYEQELSSLAKKEKKDIIGLETIQEQMEIVSNMPIEDQINDLKTTTASMLRDYNKLLEAYLAQDLAALKKQAYEHDSMESMEVELLTKRNDRWVKDIQDKIGEKSYFIAVGAMHLVGEDGLINQLQSAGYTVEAVK